MSDVTSSIETRLTRVEERLGVLVTQDDMNARFDEVPTRAEMNAQFDEVRAEMRAGFAERPTRDEMNARFDEMSRHFGILLEDQRGATRLLGEGLAALGERMERGFAEVREMFLSQQRLWERRLRRLEDRG